MKVIRLEVRRLPGIREPFAVEGFGSGLTVLLGPNAVGKTSLCRAITGLLWPDLGDRAAVSLTAHVEVAGRRLVAEREGRRVVWQCDGALVDPPPVPDIHLARCYVVGFDDLLDASATDEQLAARVRREMAGGYDLEAVRTAAPFALGARHGRREADALGAAMLQRVQAERAHADLRRREDGLPDLEARRRSALEAAAEVRRLEAALALAEARRDLAACDAQLAVFPIGMDRLHGNEGARLAEIEGAIAALAEERPRRAADAACAAAALDACGLPADGVDDGSIGELRERVGSLRALEGEHARTQADLAGAAAACAAAERTLAGAATGAAPTLAPATLARAEAWIARAAELAALQRQLRTEMAALGVDEPRADATTLRRAADALRAWLASPAPVAALRLARAALVGVTALATVLAGVLAVGAHPAFGGAAGAAVALLVLGWRALGTSPSRGARDAHRAAFLDTGIEQPARWERDAVARRLDAIDAALAVAAAVAERGVRRQALHAREAALADACDALEAERNGLLAAAAIDPAVGDLALVPLVRAVDALLGSRRETARLGAVAGEQRRRIGCEAGALSGALAAFGEPPAGDAAALLARVESLATRERRRAAAVAEHRRAEERLTELDRELAAARERSAVLLGEAGATDPATLAERLAIVPRWRELRGRRESAARSVDERTRALGDHAERLTLDEATLAARLAAAREEASTSDALLERIATIRRDVEHARSDGRLGDALAAETTARDALGDRLDAALVAAAGELLLDDVAQAHAVEACPAVLATAASWFGRFTRHAWRLELGCDGGGFRARENATGEPHGLAELSSGTRMQLLLAVRLAVAVDAERGEPLPLFLDEALTTTDPSRLAAVVDTLRALADAGRQIVYCTSQPGDAAAFGAGAAGVALVDLARQRRLAAVASDAHASAVPADGAIPPPNGDTPDAYAARLGVPDLDLRAPVAAMHLFHLLRDDLGLLHRLLEAGCERVGQLEVLLRDPGSDALVGAGDAARLRAWLAVARDLGTAWSVGRGPRVDREVLDTAGVNGRWIDPMTAVAGEHRGDAGSLLETLARRGDRDPRLRGLQERLVERLREQLERQGHLDPRPPLDDDTIVSRVVAASAGGTLPPATVQMRVRALLHLAHTTG